MNSAQLVTGAQMTAIDRRAIDRGAPGIDLMTAAGRGVAGVVEDFSGGFQDRRIVILCGKGNNGGDGFVFARLAHERGAEVRVFLTASPDDVGGDARLALDRIGSIPVAAVLADRDVSQVQAALEEADVAIDALLGTGVQGAPRGPIATVIAALSKAPCPIVAVDVPSGLDADTGQAEGLCAAADITVTFARPRVGQFFYPGRSLCGRLHVVDIGITDAVVDAENVHTFLIEPFRVASLLPKRQPDAHKGDCGRACVVAGSVGLTGAAALAATAALRGGAGLVTLGVPESLNDILETKVTEAMTRPLPEVRKSRCLSLRARGDIRRLIRHADAVALGPGLGTHRETSELVRRLVREDLASPAVLDADALDALAVEPDAIRQSDAPLILTPHPGEFSRLTGCGIADIRRDPIATARAFAIAVQAVVILKGAPTVIGAPGGEVHVNPSGNPGLATGGTGDVLTGLITALLAQGLSPIDAAQLGVYLHGLAGDIAAGKTGHIGLIAGDVVQAIPNAMQHVLAGKDAHRYLRHHSQL